MEMPSWIQFVRKWSTWHFPGNDKDIIIISTPRSGSTWLMEIIGSVSGLKPIREPLNLRKPEVPDMLGFKTWEESYTNANQNQIISYLKVFSKSNFYDRRFKRERPLSSTWHFLTHRLVYKILHGAEHMLSVLEESLDAHVILLVRHPIPVSLSREVAPRTAAMLKSDFAKNFNQTQLNLATEILRSGDDFKISVLDWCLQNKVPLANWKPNWTLVSYEEMVTDPEGCVKKLFTELGLKTTSKTKKMLYRASGSSGKSDTESQNVIFDKEKIMSNREWLISKWKDKVTEEELNETFHILKIFEIDLYTSDSALLNPKYQAKPYA